MKSCPMDVACPGWSNKVIKAPPTFYCRHLLPTSERREGDGRRGVDFFGHLNQFFGKYIALNMLDMLNGISVREEARRWGEGGRREFWGFLNRVC